MATLSYGSIEIYFTCLLDEVSKIDIETGVRGFPSFASLDEDSVSSEIKVRIALEEFDTMDIYGNPGLYLAFYTYMEGEVVDRSDYRLDSDLFQQMNFRAFFSDNRISIYANGKWVYSYIFQQAQYLENDPDVHLRAIGGPLTVNSIRRVELCDSREAIYIDYESTADNAISSVIQERPVEIWPGIDREAEYTYSFTKAEVNMVKLTNYDETISHNRALSSDGLVYGRDVTISIDHITAEEVGLVTRLYRLPDLSTGTDRAVKAIQKKARQDIEKRSIIQRFDPRVEHGDVSIINTIVTGTQTAIEKRTIIQSVSIDISDGTQKMTLLGRKEDA